MVATREIHGVCERPLAVSRRWLATSRTLIVVAVLAFALHDVHADSACGGVGMAVQVLGSGGPIADDGRSSSAYVVWTDGRARVLVDFGSGAFLRAGEAGLDFRDLDLVALSHYHTDHAADFPALLKSGSFSGRTRPLPVAGPDGSDPFPGLDGFLQANLNRDHGAWAYLAGFLDGGAGLPELKPVEVPRGEAAVRVHRGEDGLTVDAMHVPHGIVPALAFRVTQDDRTVVFAGDQNGTDARFVDFAAGADLLVLHMAVPEGVSGPAGRLHASPGRLGELAAAIDPGAVVLSHFMARSLRELRHNVGLLQAHYDGPVTPAQDLDCFALPPPAAATD